MLIDDSKWSEIILATQPGIEQWNSHAAKHQQPDRFEFRQQSNDRYSFILTVHDEGAGSFQTDTRGLARELATGEMRAVKTIRKRGRLIGLQPQSDPKAWRTLANKPAADIVKQTRLLNFMMVLGVHPVKEKKAG